MEITTAWIVGMFIAFNNPKTSQSGKLIAGLIIVFLSVTHLKI